MTKKFCNILYYFASKIQSRPKFSRKYLGNVRTVGVRLRFEFLGDGQKAWKGREGRKEERVRSEERSRKERGKKVSSFFSSSS